MYIREILVIALTVILIGGLVWTLKAPQQTKPKFCFALGFALLGLVAIVMSVIQGNSAGIRGGLVLAMLWGGVTVLTATTRTWQRIAGWSLMCLAVVVYIGRDSPPAP
jgi:hypothetical protein